MISAQIAADWYWAAWGWCLADIRRRRRVRLTIAFVHDGTTVCEYRGHARSSLWAAQVEGAEVEEVGLLGEADAGLGDEELAGTVKQGQRFFALPDFAEAHETILLVARDGALSGFAPYARDFRAELREDQPRGRRFGWVRWRRSGCGLPSTSVSG